MGKCPHAEFKDRENNLAACWPTDSICEEFHPKNRYETKMRGQHAMTVGDTRPLPTQKELRNGACMHSGPAEEVNSAPVMKSGNFHNGLVLSDKNKLILKQVEDSLYSITPSEISSNTGINANTVRKYLRDLENKGFVHRKFHGHYVSARNLVISDRCMVSGVSGVRVHGLRFRVLGVGVGEGSWCRDFGVLRLRFVVHGNGNAEVFVGCGRDVSLNYVAFRLVVGVVCRELGCDWDQVLVTSCEFNRDFLGVKLDGVKSVTLKAFDGSFRRVYNHGGFLRDEVKTVGSKKIEDVLALMQGGVTQYNIQQLLYMNFQKLSEYVEAGKFRSQLVFEAVSEMRRFVEAMMRM